ncbi:MAG: T9SS type A sorting domain-containing protein [Bacteroidota bacterium]
MDGEAADDRSGYSVSLSSDGSVLAIGAAWNDGNGTDAGHVRVYGNPTIGITENTINSEVWIYPNPTSGIVIIETEGIEKTEVIDLQGKQIYVGNEKEIDLSQEPEGVYIIKVITGKQTVIRKLIKQ